MPIKVYLAGKVPKGADQGATKPWRDAYREVLALRGLLVEILDPDDPSLDESFPEAVFGHDCWLISNSDVVVVNATEKLGVGTSQEMLIAKHFGKPVLTVLPKDSHHRRSNLKMHAKTVPDWIHPFIYQTSDAIIESLDELPGLIEDLSLLQPKGMEIIQRGIDVYLSSRERST